MSTYKCTQLSGLDSVPPSLSKANEVFGKLRVIRGTYTTTGSEANGETIEIARLHDGLKVIPLGKVVWEDLGTGVSVQLGYAAYTDKDGSSVSADPDAFLASTDVSSGAGEADLVAAAGVAFEADPSVDDVYVTVEATLVLSGTSPSVIAGKTLDFFLVVAQE